MINPVKILANDRSSPILVLRAMFKELGHKWVNWEPETIWDEILNETNVIPPRVNKDKIMALKLCIKTIVPWEDWYPFTTCVLCFNDIPVDMEIAQECSPSQLAYGVKILTELQPEHIYRRDVQFMAASMLTSNGICWIPQEPFGSMVNEALEHLVKVTSGNMEAIEQAKADYAAYKKGSELGEDNIHTTRLVAIDQYIQHKDDLEERMS